MSRKPTAKSPPPQVPERPGEQAKTEPSKGPDDPSKPSPSKAPDDSSKPEHSPDFTGVAAVGTIVAPIFAFAFNVGYFSAIDISWFTFFSVSEHVVFAIRALPIAIGVSTLLGMVLYHFLKTHPDGKLHSDKQWPRVVLIGARVWIVVLVLSGLTSLMYFHFGLCFSFFAVAAGAWVYVYTKPTFGLLANVLYWSSALIFATFLIGYGSAGTNIFSSQRHSVITFANNTALVANLILAGDKKVLIYEPNQDDSQVGECLAGRTRSNQVSDKQWQIRLVLWDEISTVSLCPPVGPVVQIPNFVGAVLNCMMDLCMFTNKPIPPLPVQTKTNPN